MFTTYHQIISTIYSCRIKWDSNACLEQNMAGVYVNIDVTVAECSSDRSCSMQMLYVFSNEYKGGQSGNRRECLKRVARYKLR